MEEAKVFFFYYCEGHPNLINVKWDLTCQKITVKARWDYFSDWQAGSDKWPFSIEPIKIAVAGGG